MIAFFGLILSLSAYGQTIDADRDGFESNIDCNDLNHNINPDAVEIQLDGIDNNCNGQVDEKVILTGDSTIRTLRHSMVTANRIQELIADESDVQIDDGPFIVETGRLDDFLRCQEDQFYHPIGTVPTWADIRWEERWRESLKITCRSDVEADRRYHITPILPRIFRHGLRDVIRHRRDHHNG